MAKKHLKSSDGMYHIKGQKFPILVGSRAQVWHKTAYKTKGDLTRDHLKMNKRGRVVSKKKSMTEQKKKNVLKKPVISQKKANLDLSQKAQKNLKHKKEKEDKLL